jgi:PadR family transcriptional regulator, regulatory protein PadR
LYTMLLALAFYVSITSLGTEGAQTAGVCPYPTQCEVIFLAVEQKVQARPPKWLTPVTLVLLEEERSHGYELMKRIEEEFGFEEIRPGSVYRTLRQMEAEGLCQSEWETSSDNGGPLRRMYAITEAGEAYLAAWAEACKNYQQLMDGFARVYGRRPPSSSQ